VRFTYTYRAPDELADGRPLAFGDVVDLTAKQQAPNARLIDEGRLKPTPSSPDTKESDS
jgi:hypothetical protein